MNDAFKTFKQKKIKQARKGFNANKFILNLIHVFIVSIFTLKCYFTQKSFTENFSIKNLLHTWMSFAEEKNKALVRKIINFLHTKHTWKEILRFFF